MASCLPKQQPCRLLQSTQPLCQHGRCRRTVSIVRMTSNSPVSSRSVLLYSTGAGADGSKFDDVMDVLKDAFHDQTAPSRKNLQQDHASSTPAPSFANPTRRGSSSRVRPDSSSSSSSSSGRHVPSKAGSRRPLTAAASAAAVAPRSLPPKKRKGPYADLITALEHDIHNPIANSSSSSVQNSSNSSNSTTSAGVSQLQSSLDCSSSSSTPADRGDSSSSPRKLTRRISRQATTKAAQPQQQQQQQQAQKQQQAPPWLQQAAAVGGKKQYQPVYKGDLALPGGPSWSALRRHLVAAGTDPNLPTLHCIILVEGDQDQRAVARAVNAPVYVCDGTRVLKDHVKPELVMLQQLGRPLVVLTDPDERGRELRVHLDNSLGLLLHAFVPEPEAAALVDGPVHAAGNRGIEHVVPTGVQQALQAARRSYPPDRQVWSMAGLQELRLVNAFDGGAAAARGPGGAADRRRQLCALLGLGQCNGGQLLNMLNRFFDAETVDAALAQLEPPPGE